MKIVRYAILISFCTVFVASQIRAQLTYDTPTDSLVLNPVQVDELFFKNNLSLLAQRYQIDVDDAAVMQAKLFPNPEAQLLFMPYNQQTRTSQFIGKHGDVVVQVSQLFQLAGKRNKAVQLAASNATLSKLQFFDLLRTLQYSLHSDFYNLYYLQQSAAVYKEEISSLSQVANAYVAESAKGYISQKEVIRVKGQVMHLQSEYNDLQQNINDLQSELRILLNVKPIRLVPQITDQSYLLTDVTKNPFHIYLDSAQVNRTDLKIAKEQTHQGQLNLSYQKALAVPDLTAMASYAQQSGYPNNEVQVGVAMSLPFFNRNQGNIRAAHSQIKLAQANEDIASQSITENVYRAYQKAMNVQQLLQNIDPNLSADFKDMELKVLDNYKKRNIGILDFLDFYDSYKDQVLETNQLKYNKAQALQDLNFYTASRFF